MTKEQLEHLTPAERDLHARGLADLPASTRVVLEPLRTVAELRKFKAYVHKRLDDAGVSVDPESSHKAEGCRIGGRLDEVFAERDALRARVAALEGALPKTADGVMIVPGMEVWICEEGVSPYIRHVYGICPKRIEYLPDEQTDLEIGSRLSVVYSTRAAALAARPEVKA